LVEVKKRKIQAKDWDRVQAFIKEELDSRKKSKFRTAHEVIWKEVDRQLKMEPLKRINQAGQEMPMSWNSAIELGELSKASEVIAADVMRITFPQERDWFECHVEIPPLMSEQGPVANEEAQIKVDNLLRAMMAQQHIDFGFKRSFELSVKEALHHGSFVAEVDWDSEMMVQDGSKVKSIAAPCWVPHSMWNCYPDPSPRVVPSKMFYTGSMIIVSYMPLHKLKGMKGEGWMQAQFKKIPKQEHKNGEVETKDVELVKFYGDLVIPRSDGEDIYLPNSKAILANGIIVYWAPNDLPYPSVIFGGYEKQDVRDPYYMSPIIKQSPIGKLASILANKFIDAISLKTEPPIVYDGNDPYFVANDGPVIAPGVKTATKGSTAYQQVEIGDPNWALEGLQMTLRQLQEGTGVNAVRTGTPNSDRQTATEVQKIAQGAEVRTVDFIDKLNGNLRTWLYMQHAMNLKNLKEYAFYNEDIYSPDFIRITKSDLKEAEVAHFDVVGARGLLGEEQRSQKMSLVTAFASGNPLFAPLLKPAELLIEAYRDAGVKNPERFVNVGEQQPDPRMQEMEAVIQELQAQLQQEQQKTEAKIMELEMRREKAMADAELAREKAETDAELKARELAMNYELKIAEVKADLRIKEAEAQAKMHGTLLDMEAKMDKMRADIEISLEKARSEGVSSSVLQAIREMKPPTVNVNSGGKKRIKLPGGREATVEDD
jgi:hypothetical protein